MLSEILLLTSLTAGALAAGTTTGGASAQTTERLLLGNQPGDEYAASVIKADSCDTTYAIVCTSGSYSLGDVTGTCDGQQTATATYGKDSYEFSTATSADGVQVTISESCSLKGTTQAVCTESFSASGSGTSTASKTTVTLSGDQLHYYQVPVTAGADKLSGNGQCTATGNAAAPTAMSNVYKVVVVPGAAALMAGMML